MLLPNSKKSIEKSRRVSREFASGGFQVGSSENAGGFPRRDEGDRALCLNMGGEGFSMV